MLTYDLDTLIDTISMCRTTVDVLRLDKIDADISGNKWFKLKHHLQEAINMHAATVSTYGGVYSNHIAAFSSACHRLQLQHNIYIRSDEHLNTPTLVKAKKQGANIIYCTRPNYKIIKHNTGLLGNEYFIPEGGATELGLLGAAEILQFDKAAQYDIIYCSIGTGTTFAGLVAAAKPHQQVIGINAVKTPFSPTLSIFNEKQNWQVIENAHWGGFAKYNIDLINFINQFYTQTNIPTDIVYTSKLFYALQKMLETDTLLDKKKLLVIHSGGLQGNLSLPENTFLWQQ